MAEADSRDELARTVVQESPDLGVVLLADDPWVCLFATGAGNDAGGPGAGDLEGQSLPALIHADDRDSVQSALARAADGDVVTVTFRLVLRDGDPDWCELHVRRPVRRPERPVLVGALRAVEPRSAEVTASDPLTGLVGRPLLQDRLVHALSRLSRAPGLVALLFLDLDRFKQVNDHHGHRAGDRVLETVAQRVTSVLRPTDTFARLGGDEFCVLLEDLGSPAEATALAQRVAEVVRSPIRLDSGEEVVVTLSTGISLTQDPDTDHQHLLDEADQAMYRAKALGRDRTETFDDRMRRRSVSRTSTVQLLQRAIEERLLCLQFQPVVDVADGAVVAVEALVRVTRTGRAPLLPAAFLDVAQDTGLLHHIDRWVLEAAVQQAAAWAGEGLPAPLAVGVNLSGRAVGDLELAPRLLSLLEEHGIDGSALQLQVREHDLATAPEAALAGLARLRSAGVRVGMDGFGAGSACFGELPRYPLDFLEIDRAITAGVGTSASARAMAHAVVEVGHALGLAVVAEGVETGVQRDVVQQLACDQAQGFFWGRATDAAGVASMARRPRVVRLPDVRAEPS